MRVALLSDIHANLHALEAVARDIEAQRIHEIWSLGDVVGYGGHPRECIDWVKKHATVCVKGNHDEAVATGDVAWFNPMAAQAARIHAQRFTPPERSAIYGWPTTITRDINGDATLIVHASPDDALHEYVQPQDARLGLRRWEGRARIIVLGHTHRPFAAYLDDGAAAHAWRALQFQETIHDKRATRNPLLLVNPGSVGQPRDGDPRAAYAVLDFAERSVELRRVDYDIASAAQAILKEGLDQLLALRLYEGR
jgi:predicted phosphodiesterase